MYQGPGELIKTAGLPGGHISCSFPTNAVVWREGIFLTDQHTTKSPPTPTTLLASIPNGYPTMLMHVRLTYPFAQLCPISGEPQPGSTITISYHASALLLETKALRQYLASFRGENPHGVRDLEQAAQVIAQECANILHTQVDVSALYHLSIGDMQVDVQAEPHA
jgi:7-cyano-7-deazaguanine reductase